MCCTCVLVMPVTIKVGLPEVGNQAKSLKYYEISFICYQYRAEAPAYSHLPQYRVTQKKRELLKNPTKIEEIKEKKIIDRN